MAGSKTTFVALLRGVNVGGHKKIPMADLRDFAADLGFEDPQTLLQSGNLVLRGVARTAVQLERLLETEAESRLGLRTSFFVRSVRQWQTVVARNPYPQEAETDPAHLGVMTLKKAAGTRYVEALRAAIKGPELVTAIGQQLYLVYPDGIGRSKLTNTLIEKKLGTLGTSRNWNTVLKLAALLGG